MRSRGLSLTPTLSPSMTAREYGVDEGRVTETRKIKKFLLVMGPRSGFLGLQWTLRESFQKVPQGEGHESCSLIITIEQGIQE